MLRKKLPEIPNFAIQNLVLVHRLQNAIFLLSKNTNLVSFVKFSQKTNIFVTTASFRHFDSCFEPKHDD